MRVRDSGFQVLRSCVGEARHFTPSVLSPMVVDDVCPRESARNQKGWEFE
jgi:hypothetical protein